MLLRLIILTLSILRYRRLSVRHRELLRYYLAGHCTRAELRYGQRFLMYMEV
jgi:hypothetical protein